jgi:hypothetical protein
MFQPCNQISDPSEKMDTETARPRHQILLVGREEGREERGGKGERRKEEADARRGLKDVVSHCWHRECARDE